MWRPACLEKVDLGVESMWMIKPSVLCLSLKAVRILTCVISEVYLSTMCRMWQYLFANLHRPCTSAVLLLHPMCLIRFLSVYHFKLILCSFWPPCSKRKRFREEVIRTLASIPVPEICILNCCLSQQDERLACNSSASASHSALCVPGLDYTNPAE